LAAAIRRADDADAIGVQVQRRYIDDLSNDAPQIRELDVDVGEIHLSPRGAKAARRIAQHCEAVREKRISEITEAAVTASPAVLEGDERMRSAAGRHGKPHVEKRTVEAREKARALPARIRRALAIEPGRPRAGEDVGPLTVRTETLRWRRTILPESRRWPPKEQQHE